MEVAPPLGVVAVLLCEVGGLFGGLQPYLFYHGDSISPFLCHCLSSSLGLLDLPHMIPVPLSCGSQSMRYLVMRWHIGGPNVA